MKLSSHSWLPGLIAGVTALSALIPSANAAWSGPTYTISNRICTPANNAVTTTTYAPQGGGSPSAANYPNGATVSAKWTWVPNPFVPNEQVPQDVYILQYGYASWNMAPGTPPAGMMSQPSFQEASFSPQRRSVSPRRESGFRLLQTQTGTGSANNGLGDSQAVTTSANGYTTGTSEGYKVIVCHPDLNGVLTIPDIALLASANPGPGSGPNGLQQYMPAWKFTAQVMTLQMTRNGVDVTNPNKPEVPVMVGERNQMGVTVSPIPSGAGIAPPTYTWSIPGSIVKGYNETGNSNVTPKIPFKGEKVALPAADLLTQSPYFYWYDATFAGTPLEVSVVVTIDEKPITIKGKFKVYRPQMNSFWGQKVTPNPGRPLVDADNVTIAFYPGMNFFASVTTPNIPTAQGQIGMLQIGSTNFKTKELINGAYAYFGTSGSQALDSDDDNPLYGTGHSFDSTRSIAANATATTSTVDQPRITNPSSVLKVNSQDTFTIYLVYKPSAADSIRIYLGKVDWSWSAAANRSSGTDDFIITSYTPTAPGTISPSEVEVHDLPQWEKRLQDLPFDPIPAW